MYSLFSYAILIALLIYLYFILNEQAKSLKIKRGKHYLSYSPYAIVTEELKEDRYESALAFLKIHIVDLMNEVKEEKEEKEKLVKRFKLIRENESKLIRKNRFNDLINEYEQLILKLKENLQLG